jgi:hypothetical protein
VVNKQRASSAEERERARELERSAVATIADLERCGAQVDWLWPGWIQRGVLTAIAAPGGTGKTRLCADLLRRIRQGETWPDGRAVALPRDSRALWVVSDNHHDEMVSLTRAFGIADGVYVNATPKEPYGGVMLETQADFLQLGRRIKAVQPAFVVLDTVGNATDKNLSKQEDAKAFYQPLQVQARLHRCAILCLTHLNAAGEFLGRRVREKVRVAIRIEQPNEADPKRRLEVVKSNSVRPAPLGLMMGDNGNRYDDQPPARMVEGPGKAAPKVAPRLKECADWLREYLAPGARKVSDIRIAAEEKEFGTKTLYRARDELDIREFADDKGRKWWQLPAEKEACPDGDTSQAA